MDVTIPENIQQICRNLAETARQNGLLKFSGRFTPDYEMGWGGEVSFAWEAGRHGESSNQIDITSTFYVHTKVHNPKKAIDPSKIIGAAAIMIREDHSSPKKDKD